MKLKHCSHDCFVKPHADIRLRDWPSSIDPLTHDKDDYKQTLESHVEKLSDLQTTLYADQRYALLVIFQGMDASGKDGAIKHVMSGVNPQGCQVHSFKQPSAEERAHDFLWRTTCRLPQRGQIGIFNRSYYEEVLIARVHPEVIQNEQLPETVSESKSFWEHRYQSIVDFEKHLHRNGTAVVKFFLHLSKAEQRRRFLSRIDTPDKNWKFSPSDAEERKYWADYQKAYEQCLGATSSAHAPWYVVPADDKHNARLIISQILIDTLKELPLRTPVNKNRTTELKAMRRLLEK